MRQDDADLDHRGPARTHDRLIIVTHDSRVYGYGDRIIEMGDGRVTGVSASAGFGESHA